jgi:hypothetical protein
VIRFYLRSGGPAVHAIQIVRLDFLAMPRTPVILAGAEMNVESYRRRAALDRKRSSGRPPTYATIKDTG